MFLTADKGVVLVAINKDMYIEKHMALQHDNNVYHECKDKMISNHAKVFKQLFSGKKNCIRPEFKDQ